MKEKLCSLVKAAIEAARSQNEIKSSKIPEIIIEIPGNRAFGDYSTNITILLSKTEGKDPVSVAQIIRERIVDREKLLKAVEIPPLGFINFYLKESCLQSALLDLKNSGDSFGASKTGSGKKVLVEFVSANPTGPLHVGHGRWAVIGDVLANLLEKAGYKVEREYYINDVGTQVNLLVESVKAAAEGGQIPPGGYGGEYTKDIALKVKDKIKSQKLKESILKLVIDDQRKTLEDLGIKFDFWFKESSLHKEGKVKDVVSKLKRKGTTFEEGGAVWFKSKELGDDKNRVLIREDGEPTYFAADIAYHINKFERGYDRLINVWGADHHGYVARLKGAMKVLDEPDENLNIIIGQLVSLFRGKEEVRMSKRTGEMITLEEVIEEIGKDEARFFFAMLPPQTHLDFDLELAKRKGPENPVYYVQYAHARICSILREAEKYNFKPKIDANLSLLSTLAERNLMLKLEEFPDEVIDSARGLEIHRLTTYARELSSTFHSFYQKCRVISPDAELTKARLLLVDATRIVIKNVLKLLGITAPERM